MKVVVLGCRNCGAVSLWETTVDDDDSATLCPSCRVLNKLDRVGIADLTMDPPASAEDE